MSRRRTFGPSEDSVAEARGFVAEALADLAYELRDAVTVMVSELSTNALVHASTGFDIDIEQSTDAVVVSVSDRGDGAPEVLSPDSTEPHGRGLRIVEALSDDWGVISSPESGKTIWFRIALSRPPMGSEAGGARVRSEEVGADRGGRRGTPFAAPETTSESGPSNQPSAHHRVPRRPSRATPRAPHRRRSPVSPTT